MLDDMVERRDTNPTPTPTPTQGELASRLLSEPERLQELANRGPARRTRTLTLTLTLTLNPIPNPSQPYS